MCDWIDRSFEILVYLKTLIVFLANQCLPHRCITIVFLQVPLFTQFRNSFLFFISLAESCKGSNCDHKLFTEWVILRESCIYLKQFILCEKNSSGHQQIPNETILLRVIQPIRSPENPGTTVVCFRQGTSRPEHPGYRNPSVRLYTQLTNQIFLPRLHNS